MTARDRGAGTNGVLGGEIWWVTPDNRRALQTIGGPCGQLVGPTGNQGALQAIDEDCRGWVKTGGTVGE